MRLDDGPVPVEIRMSARFEPIEGRFRWAGRTGPHDVLRERVGSGLRKATLVVPGSPETAVKLSDPDPWGGIRISGTGTPPWFPPANQPATDDPTARVAAAQPAAGQPTAAQSAAGQPTAGHPAGGQPAAGQAAAGQPTAGQRVAAGEEASHG
ncbi:DUF4873 domain-containing protein [Actinoplanes sp. CA-252034]|uniref:DUF4873 domain-containing protein n=1 Tax=Actinoplanes sp. CA-252034 TaxID=3239906 RepID=UPI003D974158